MKRLLLITIAILFVTPLFAVVDRNVPDKEGATLKGVVYCGDSPVKGVQISDGNSVTVTDEKGHYYLASDKSLGYVFICNPKGYVVECDGKNPLFYKFVDGKNPSVIEQIDFEIFEDKYTDHSILFLADVQMCGRNNDRSQFLNHIVPEINSTIKEKHLENRGVYIVTLGDQTYDHYWDTYGFRIPESKSYFNRFEADAIYQCIGNHDHDPKVFSDDWGAGVKFRENWGPTYYSVNIGNSHLIVLDNIVYKNANGERDYDCDITNSIFKWMRRDLANVSKDTPILICMHAPLFNRPQCSAPDKPTDITYHYNFGTTFYNSIKDFKNVQVFTGHAHTNYTAQKFNMLEYNVGATCGNLWWPSYFVNGNFVCSDGSPGGYRVMDLNGDELITYYKSHGYNKDFQFRSYDLNNTYMTADKFAPALADKALFDKWLDSGNYGFGSSDYNADGSAKQPNQILINVFAYDPRWSVEVFENGAPLKVSRISGYDPFAMISDGAQRFQNTGHNSSGNPTKNSHLFIVQATSPTSTLDIRVTDPFGKVYVENMKRPKEFSIEKYMNEDGVASIRPIIDDSEEDTQTEYYSLTGMRIKRPDSGPVIVRKGSVSRKIIL